MIPAYLYALLLAIAVIPGKAVYRTNSIRSFFATPASVAVGIGTIILFTAIFGTALWLVFRAANLLLSKSGRERTNAGIRSFLIFWAVFFAAHIPTFLAWYPGINGYDLFFQSRYALGIRPYTKYHPPIHTFIWQLCLMVGKQTGLEAISIYCIVQMLLLSAVFSAVIVFLWNRNAPLPIIFVGVLHWALNPVIAIFFLEPIKDVWFAAFCILSVMELYDFVRARGKVPVSKLVRLITWMLLAALFRNNAIYAFLLFFIILFAAFRGARRQSACLAASVLICYLLISDVLYPALGVEPGWAREFMSVPSQQVAMTVMEDENELSQEELDEIDKYLPADFIKEHFNPRFADPMKDKLGNESMDTEGFIKLWLKLMPGHLRAYADAFLSLNIPSWYPFSKAIDPYARREYIEAGTMNIEGYYGFSRESKLPGLLDFYESVKDFSAFEGNALLRIVFNLAFPIWAVLFFAAFSWFRRGAPQLLVFLPVIFYWMTFLLGPVSNLRYVIPEIMMLPLLLGIANMRDKVKGRSYVDSRQLERL